MRRVKFDTLHQSGSKGISRIIEALNSSLRDLMKNDEAIRKEYESLNMWLNADVPEKVKNKRLKVNDKDSRAIFKKESEEVQAVLTNDKESQKSDEEQAVSTNDKKSQEIDIRNWEQGSYVESILEHVERALFRFLIFLNPSKLKQEITMRTGITQIEGRWCDEKLQRLSTLSLELVDCLEKDDRNRTRRVGYFALDIVNKLKSTDEGHLSQIVRLAVDEEKAFVNIWKSLVTRKDESARIQKFISLMNVCFDMTESGTI
ncbi:2518_t:CDS:2 [Funneliformis mosseae]|uniref:2518_t:CDS:1 n=1 Tax=Funneliformis mosseae TaxID=27381 RepID=A0A9N9G8N6_FUNMO|nr:2518_t:CDS:2 [Funneliformis mosseae]